MTKEQIRKEYKLARFRAGNATTQRERRRWLLEAAALKREYETYTDGDDMNREYKGRVLPRRSILNSKTTAQINDMIAHYQGIVDSGELIGAIYRGVRIHNVIREHIAKLKAVLESRSTSSFS